MKPFKHILCPVDFSQSSRKAAALAHGIAKDFEADLTILHVVDTATLTSLGNLVPLEEVFAQSRQWAEGELNTLGETIDLSKARVEVAEGAPHRVITKRAKETGADLLVMATHGFSGFERLVLGSVTEKVLHQVEVPLLAVSQRGRVEEYPAAERFRTILMAVDFGPGTVAIAEHALALGQHYRSKVLAVYVLSPPQEMLGDPGAPWVSDRELARIRSEWKRERMTEMEKLIPTSVREVCDTVPLVLEGNPVEVLQNLVEEKDVDLVIMGAHGHGKSALGWLGSNCHKMIRGARCPILAVRKKV